LSQNNPVQITELDRLSPLEAMADRYRRTFGTSPLNLSHWDPSPQFRDYLLQHLRLDDDGDPVGYRYSYYLETHNQLLKRLGFPDDKFLLATPGGTISMLLTAVWLKEQEVERLVVLCPTYFPVFYHCKMLRIDYYSIPFVRHRGEYFVPREAIVKQLRRLRGRVAVWLTQPVFCTGVYLLSKDIAFFRDLLDEEHILVADECLALDGLELGRELGRHPNFFGVYSPHKALPLNAVKFSAIVCNERHRKFFEQWADVIYGGLSRSALTAIQHYLSDNFRATQTASLRRLAAALRQVCRIAASYREVEFDQRTSGHFITIYLPNIQAALGHDQAYMWRVMRESGAYFIPGTRNHFPQSLGLCFRVNLSLASPQFFGALGRLLRESLRSANRESGIDDDI
jgi:histidinol-phosphate/aromatic aminotransferase/cobyric acid decarboxylase-like protein